ncbi:MAG: antibiotic biosynthesis monooxygenase [Halobacterium sp.]
MIARVWRGWTTESDADEYEAFLTAELLPDATADVEGFVDYDVLRRDDGERVEFVTILRFESWDAVEGFAGEDYEAAHVPERAAELLAEYQDGVDHYDVRA